MEDDIVLCSQRSLVSVLGVKTTRFFSKVERELRYERWMLAGREWPSNERSEVRICGRPGLRLHAANARLGHEQRELVELVGARRRSGECEEQDRQGQRRPVHRCDDVTA